MKAAVGLLLLLSFGFAGHSQSTPQLSLQDLRYVDIRDVSTYGAIVANDNLVPVPGKNASFKITSNPAEARYGASGIILKNIADVISADMHHYPGSYGTSGSNRYDLTGAHGPEGRSVQQADGNAIYVISKDHPETRQNIILMAEFENVTYDASTRHYLVNLIIFAHDSTLESQQPSGYYFRRINLTVDVSRLPGQIIKREYPEDIPLAQTNFKLMGDLIDRKVILIDYINNITYVFPVGVGGVDANPDIGDLDLMTPEFPNASLRKITADNPSGTNTRSRTFPEYYSGRPYLGIFDNSENGTGEYGIHYQLDSFLTRGFLSHGCMRTRDKDLYVLEAILDGGPNDSIPVTIRKYLPEYENLEHPFPKVSTWFWEKTYVRNAPADSTPKQQYCAKQNKYYTTQFYNGYHTIADNDCLTAMHPTTGSIADLKNFVLDSMGVNAYASQPNYVPDDGAANSQPSFQTANYQTPPTADGSPTLVPPANVGSGSDGTDISGQIRLVNDKIARDCRGLMSRFVDPPCKADYKALETLQNRLKQAQPGY